MTPELRFKNNPEDIFSQCPGSFWKQLTRCLELQNADHALHWDVLAAEEQGTSLVSSVCCFYILRSGICMTKCEMNRETILVPVSNAEV